MAKAKKAAKRQGQGSSLRGEAVTSHTLEMQPLEPFTEAMQLHSLSYRAWSPDGVRKQASHTLMATLDRAEAFSAPILSGENDWQPPLKRSNLVPEATFTPTATWLCPRENQRSEIPEQIRALISEAIVCGIAAGLQQGRQISPVASDTTLHQNQQPTQAQRDWTAFQGPHSQTPSRVGTPSPVMKI